MAPPKQLQQLTDQCVQCGLCLPHCPTFAVSHDENRSPRGRIALIKALDQGQLPPSQRLADHLNSCLNCRQCEAACPRDVDYHQILIQGRARLQQSPLTKQTMPWPIRWLSQGGWRRRLLHALTRGLQQLGLQHVLPATQALPQSVQEFKRLPKLNAWPQWQQHYPTKHPPQQTVLLVRGCISDSFAVDSIKATITLLNHLRCDVLLTTRAACCGALAYHQGEVDRAKQQIDDWQQLHQDKHVDAIIQLDSACYLHLTEQIATPLPLFDASRYIYQLAKQQNLQLLTNPTTYALHLPCSQRRLPDSSNAIKDLLSLIPAFKLIPLTACCGAGGANRWHRPQSAQHHAEILINELKANHIHHVLSHNHACLLHLQQSANAMHYPLSVIHPLTLVSKQIYAQKRA